MYCVYVVDEGSDARTEQRREEKYMVDFVCKRRHVSSMVKTVQMPEHGAEKVGH